jgi:hypothetical protein
MIVAGHQQGLSPGLQLNGGFHAHVLLADQERLGGTDRPGRPSRQAHGEGVCLCHQIGRWHLLDGQTHPHSGFSADRLTQQQHL